MGSEVRKAYHEDLKELKKMVEDMGILASRAISLAVDSFVDNYLKLWNGKNQK